MPDIIIPGRVEERQRDAKRQLMLTLYAREESPHCTVCREKVDAYNLHHVPRGGLGRPGDATGKRCPVCSRPPSMHLLIGVEVECHGQRRTTTVWECEIARSQGAHALRNLLRERTRLIMRDLDRAAFEGRDEIDYREHQPATCHLADGRRVETGSKE